MRYSNGKGIFDLDFEVRKGEVVGFLGPNGAGKTSTIRCLLGFIQGQSGTCEIDDKNCFENAPEISKNIGFIAGEPAFPEGMTGVEYLEFLLEVRKGDDVMRNRMNELIKYFEFDPKGKIKRMSKGMKQKTAIVAAFMHSPDVYVLDEPTSGLDPVMQGRFVDLVMREKSNGKTILMSSHMFDEVEKTADFVIIIKDGRIVAKDKFAVLKQKQKKIYFVQAVGVDKIEGFDMNKVGEDQAEFLVGANDIGKFIKEVSKLRIDVLTSKEVSLESIFMDYYVQHKEAK